MSMPQQVSVRVRYCLECYDCWHCTNRWRRGWWEDNNRNWQVMEDTVCDKSSICVGTIICYLADCLGFYFTNFKVSSNTYLRCNWQSNCSIRVVNVNSVLNMWPNLWKGVCTFLNCDVWLFITLIYHFYIRPSLVYSLYPVTAHIKF